MAFKVLAFGLKLPLPPLHEALNAEPLKLPLSVTAGLLAHTCWSAPALALAFGDTVRSTVSTAFEHDVPVTVSTALTFPTPPNVITGFRTLASEIEAVVVLLAASMDQVRVPPVGTVVVAFMVKANPLVSHCS